MMKRRRPRNNNAAVALMHFIVVVLFLASPGCICLAASASSPLSKTPRVGQTAPEASSASDTTAIENLGDDELDDYIEKLVSSIDTSEVEDALGDKEIEHDKESDVEENAELKIDDEKQDGVYNDVGNVLVDHQAESTVEEADEAAAADGELLDKALDVDTGSVDDETESMVKVTDGASTTKKRKRKKKQKDVESIAKERPNESSTVKSASESPAADESKESTVPEETQPAVPYRRPNVLYRFLLGQGRIGHVIVMICVMMVEWIKTYVPTMVNLLSWLLSGIVRGNDASRSGRQRPIGPGTKSKVNAQYGAFVGTDGSTVRGKQRKKLTKQADQKALQQLKRVGSVKEAKYRHLSVDFMKRHSIGPFATLGEQRIVRSKRPPATLVEEEEDEQSSVDWVVEALSKEPPKKRKVSVEPTLSVGMDSRGGPKMSVGVEMSFGEGRKESVLKAATSTPKQRKKVSGPRASDRDGGGGLVGRLRSAVGSNIPSSLLGAYPGDAVPIDEAGSANGVVALARKYGYGDWSDDDDQDDSFMTRKVKRKRKKVKRKQSTEEEHDDDRMDDPKPKKKKKKRRKQSQTAKSMSFEDPFEDPSFDSLLDSLETPWDGSKTSNSFSSSSRKKTRTVSRRPGSRKRNTSFIDSSSESSNVSPRSANVAQMVARTKDRTQRNKLADQDKLVRLPMERMNERRRFNNAGTDQ